MRKHSATWLLAVLVALGAGQAVPLASARESRELSAFVQILAVRGERHIRRDHPLLAYPRQALEVLSSNDPSIAIRDSWNASHLRAPPFSAIA